MKRFQFTIRDLLWLTLVVAVGVIVWQSNRENSVLQSKLNWYHDVIRAYEFDDRYLKEKLSGATDKQATSRATEWANRQIGPGE